MNLRPKWGRVCGNEIRTCTWYCKRPGVKTEQKNAMLTAAAAYLEPLAL